MPRSPKTVLAEAGEARLFLAKAEQFLETCRIANGERRFDAAMLMAVHAAMSASDAVTVALARRRSADPNHQRAADLLEQVAGASPELRGHVRQLRELLAKKNVVEYESRRASGREAADALRRAERFVEWARQTVERARV